MVGSESGGVAGPHRIFRQPAIQAVNETFQSKQARSKRRGDIVQIACCQHAGDDRVVRNVNKLAFQYGLKAAQTAMDVDGCNVLVEQTAHQGQHSAKGFGISRASVDTPRNLEIHIGWIRRGVRGQKQLDRLYEHSRDGKVRLYISTVNLAEALIHTHEVSLHAGVDTVVFLKACGVRLHEPDEAIARRVAKLPTALADGFAVATAQELGARLHTTDSELIKQLRGKRIAISHY